MDVFVTNNDDFFQDHRLTRLCNLDPLKHSFDIVKLNLNLIEVHVMFLQFYSIDSG